MAHLLVELIETFPSEPAPTDSGASADDAEIAKPTEGEEAAVGELFQIRVHSRYGHF